MTKIFYDRREAEMEVIHKQVAYDNAKKVMGEVCDAFGYKVEFSVIPKFHVLEINRRWFFIKFTWGYTVGLSMHNAESSYHHGALGITISHRKGKRITTVNTKVSEHMLYIYPNCFLQEFGGLLKGLNDIKKWKIN